jgi:hypothetical protein
MQTGALQVRMRQLDFLHTLFSSTIEQQSHWRHSCSELCTYLRQLKLIDTICRDSLHLPAYAQSVAQVIGSMLKVWRKFWIRAQICILKHAGLSIDDLRTLWQCQYGGAHEAITRNVLHVFDKCIVLMDDQTQMHVLQWWCETCKQVATGIHFRQNFNWRLIKYRRMYASVHCCWTLFDTFAIGRTPVA